MRSTGFSKKWSSSNLLWWMCERSKLDYISNVIQYWFSVFCFNSKNTFSFPSFYKIWSLQKHKIHVLLYKATKQLQAWCVLNDMTLEQINSFYYLKYILWRRNVNVKTVNFAKY
jgi:hypothetical protein